MITLDQTRELLEQQDGIEGVEVCRNEFVRARFLNKINPKEPHELAVDPIQDRLVLRFHVSITKNRSGNTELSRVLQNFNYDLLIGKVGTDVRDGEVTFVVNHPCRDGDADDPAPEVFARLVDVVVNATHKVALLATHVGMIEAGVPKGVAQQFIEQFQEQEKQDGDDEETL